MKNRENSVSRVLKFDTPFGLLIGEKYDPITTFRGVSKTPSCGSIKQHSVEVSRDRE